MRAVLVLAAVLTLTACTSTKETSREGYRVSQEDNGDVNIEITPGASPETLMAALMEAAEFTKWTPPEAAGGLRQASASEMDAVGEMGKTSAYSYGLQGGGFSVYVYRLDATADAQIEGTEQALAQLVEQGRVDAFERVDRTAREVPWQDGEATLHRVRFAESRSGEPVDSFLYLLKDDIHWIKLRVTFTEGRYAEKDVDAMVLALLAGGE